MWVLLVNLCVNNAVVRLYCLHWCERSRYVWNLPLWFNNKTASFLSKFFLSFRLVVSGRNMRLEANPMVAFCSCIIDLVKHATKPHEKSFKRARKLEIFLKVVLLLPHQPVQCTVYGTKYRYCVSILIGRNMKSVQNAQRSKSSHQSVSSLLGLLLFWRHSWVARPHDIWMIVWRLAPHAACSFWRWLSRLMLWPCTQELTKQSYATSSKASRWVRDTQGTLPWKQLHIRALQDVTCVCVITGAAQQCQARGEQGHNKKRSGPEFIRHTLLAMLSLHYSCLTFAYCTSGAPLVLCTCLALITHAFSESLRTSCRRWGRWERDLGKGGRRIQTCFNGSQWS